jgi:hypothetical protein
MCLHVPIIQQSAAPSRDYYLDASSKKQDETVFPPFCFIGKAPLQADKLFLGCGGKVLAVIVSFMEILVVLSAHELLLVFRLVRDTRRHVVHLLNFVRAQELDVRLLSQDSLC